MVVYMAGGVLAQIQVLVEATGTLRQLFVSDSIAVARTGGPEGILTIKPRANGVVQREDLTRVVK